jgi:hypothetical protein
MSVLYLKLADQGRLSAFEKNTLKGGYLDVNRTSAKRTGWDSIMGKRMISKSQNNVRKLDKNY